MAISAIVARRNHNDMSREELEDLQRKEKFKVVFEAKEARERAKKAFEEAIEDADKAEKEAREAHVAEEKAKKEVLEAEAAERKAEAEAREAHAAEEAALKEVAEAEAAEANATRELKEAEEEESRLATMEADLAAGTGGVTAEDVQAQRDKAQKERQEAVEAVQKAKEERAEATEAKALAEKERAEAAAAANTARTERAEAAKAMEEAEHERAQATEAQALAARAERDAERKERVASTAERNAEATVWKQERVRLMMPLVTKDQVYKLIVVPAFRAVNRDKKKGKITKQQKKRLDRQFASIHLQADQLFEDFEFLQECFGIMRDEDEIDPLDDTSAPTHYMTKEAMKLWITVLNHGDEPTEEDMLDVQQTVDTYRINLLPDNADPQDAEECAELYEFGDFLVITFDYYLAMGPTRMRALFMDLLLT